MTFIALFRALFDGIGFSSDKSLTKINIRTIIGTESKDASWYCIDSTKCSSEYTTAKIGIGGYWSGRF